MGDSWQEVTNTIALRFRDRGLGVVHPFRVAWCDDSFSPALRDRWRKSRGKLGILIGNTRDLWALFVAHLRGGGEGVDVPDPLDSWVEKVIPEVLSQVGTPFHVIFAHEPPPRRLPLQRLTVHAGFAALAPSQILAHPTYGPWFALRAVAIFDLPGPDLEPVEATQPCEACAAPCLPSFEEARSVAASTTAKHVVHSNWEAWLNVRDACPIGREYRYSHEQILFHYAGRRPVS